MNVKDHPLWPWWRSGLWRWDPEWCEFCKTYHSSGTLRKEPLFEGVPRTSSVRRLEQKPSDDVPIDVGIIYRHLLARKNP